MSKVIFVSGLDDFLCLEEMAQGFAAADIKRWQRELKTGDCFVHFAEGIAIYSEILADEDDPEDNGDYRFTKSYSIVCDDGELGSVHLSVVYKKLSREQFEGLRAKGWPADEDNVKAFLRSN